MLLKSTFEYINQMDFGSISHLKKNLGRSARRRTGAGLLLDSLRSDICTERGSSSDRRRRRMGLPPAKTPAEILGIDDLVIDDSSPLANEIR